MDGVGELQRLIELQQCNVIVKGHLTVIRVGDDPLQRAPLYTILLVLVLHATVGQPVGCNVVAVVACIASQSTGYVSVPAGTDQETS